MRKLKQKKGATITGGSLGCCFVRAVRIIERFIIAEEVNCARFSRFWHVIIIV